MLKLKVNNEIEFNSVEKEERTCELIRRNYGIVSEPFEQF